MPVHEEPALGVLHPVQLTREPHAHLGCSDRLGDLGGCAPLVIDVLPGRIGLPMRRAGFCRSIWLRAFSLRPYEPYACSVLGTGPLARRSVRQFLLSPLCTHVATQLEHESRRGMRGRAQSCLLVESPEE